MPRLVPSPFWLAALLAAIVNFAFSAPPLTESSSGLPGYAAPAAATPTLAPAAAGGRPPSAPLPGAERSTAPPLHPAAPAPGAITLDDNDLDEPRPAGPEASPAPPVRAPLAVRVNGREIASNQWAILADPLEELTFEFTAPPEAAVMKLDPPAAVDLAKPRAFEFFETTRIRWDSQAGALLERQESRFRWRAPAAAGPCRVALRLERQTRFEDASATAMQAAARRQGLVSEWSAVALIRHPFNAAGDGIIEGYTVGLYPDPNRENVLPAIQQRAESYRPPRALIPVTPETEALRVSPRFRLGDFSPRSERGKPHYIALDPRLLQFLEAFAAQVEKEGLRADALRILRGYVSPYTRQRLARDGANLKEFSRHQYGDAVALILDADGDQRLDDLTGDGKVDLADADRLSALADATLRELGMGGGVGVEAHFREPGAPDTPILSVDTRGWNTSWREE